MAKYKATFEGKIVWNRVIEIEDESDPYKEAEEYLEKEELWLQKGDFVEGETIQINLKPLV